MSYVRYYRPGGRTREFGDRPFYEQFIKRFRQEEQTALWNKGLGEEDIIRGLVAATGEDESAVTAWLVEPSVDRTRKGETTAETWLAKASIDRTVSKAVDLWAAARWHKEFPRYYAVVGRHMEAAPRTPMGRTGAACLVKLMKLKADPSYIDAGLSQRLSWQQLIYGIENDIALEYLAAIIPNHDNEEEGDDDGPYF